MEKRYHELDSLRGIAAITVMIHHFLLVLPIMMDQNYGERLPWLVQILKFSPLHILWAGDEAVILFFILSGFVLSLPFLRGNKSSYSTFILKRICRLYIPYAVAVLVAILLDFLVTKGGIPQLSDMINNSWSVPISLKLITQHFLFIDSFRNYEFVPVLWSLVHEMRISLVFPVIMLLLIRFGWKRNILIGLFLAIMGFGITRYLGHSTNYYNDYFLTFEYIMMFIVGAIIAKHRTKLLNIYRSMGAMLKIILLTVGILCYTYAWLFKGISIIHKQLLDDWVCMAGAVIFIMVSISSKTVSNFLSFSAVRFLGKISFSLYLYHGIVMLCLVNMLYGIISIAYILILSVFVTLIVSTIAYYLVEEPSIRLGRNTAKMTVAKTVTN